MNKVFIGGSRHISRLSEQVRERLNNIVENGHQVIVGDANGADKAVQKFFLDVAYNNVTVFCSGDRPRNNLGQWHVHKVVPTKSVRGFQFYAVKDREMAREADFGFMIWDGKSSGTVLNILRLIRAGKKAVLLSTPDQTPFIFRNIQEWREFLNSRSPELLEDLRQRATTDELELIDPNIQPSLLEESYVSAYPVADVPVPSKDEMVATINVALDLGEVSKFVDTLGSMARAYGMTQISKNSGLARESLYRSLGANGNPEFATVLKIMAALGLRLEAKSIDLP